MEVVASLSQGRTAAAQCGLFTHKSVSVIFEPPCILCCITETHSLLSAVFGGMSEILHSPHVGSNRLHKPYDISKNFESLKFSSSRNAFLQFAEDDFKE